MPTSIPNFLNTQQTPLGAAFANLATAVGGIPAAQAQGQNTALDLEAKRRKMQGQSSLADRLAHLYAPVSPDAAPAMAAPAMSAPPQAPAGMPSAVPTPRPDPASPIASAFQATAPSGPTLQPTIPTPAPAPHAAAQPVDWGGLLKDAVDAGIDPKNLGGYNLFGAANQYGATDQRTQNAQVGSGESYDSTFGALDRKQTDLRANNADTNATSRANNAANISKDYGIEKMKMAHEDAQNTQTAGGMTPSGIDYVADIYRHTGQLPALGMGKAAAQARETIINRAQAMDAAQGRTGADAVASFADYQGQRAGQRTAGTREAQAGMAVNELTNLIPVAKQAFAGVARTGFVPADQLLQAYQNGTNDPALNQAAVAVNDVVNAHARAINPNGQVTDAGRAQGYQLLNTAKDQTAFNAILDQMMVGAHAALRSPGQTRAQMHAAGSAPLQPHGSEAAPAAEEHWTRGPNGQLQRTH
jgi:hypothetical protein